MARCLTRFITQKKSWILHIFFNNQDNLVLVDSPSPLPICKEHQHFHLVVAARRAIVTNFFLSKYSSHPLSICTQFLKSPFHKIDFGTGFLQATQAVKIKFEIDKKSSSTIKFKNQLKFFYCTSLLKVSPILDLQF